MASFGVFDSFFIIKTSQEWWRILYSPWQSKLKLKHMKNPSFGKLRSFCQINQVCKEENQIRNLTSSNFAWLCEMPKGVQVAGQRARLWKMNFVPYAKFCKPCETKDWGKWISQALRKSSCVIFRYFCTDSIRFLSRDIFRYLGYLNERLKISLYICLKMSLL